MKVSFQVMGKPQGKARPRLSRHGVYTPQATVQYEKQIRAAYLGATNGESCGVDVAVWIDAYFPIPKSWTKSKREAAERGDVIPGKPDVDNILKIVMDALNGLAYKDDAQVTRAICSKTYAKMGEPGRIEVKLNGI